MPLQLPKVRGDLQYFERQVEGELVVFVRDPIRNRFFKYNELQVAMLRACDGVHGIDYIVNALSERYELEIPRATADRFLAHARHQGLFDIASYGVPDEDAHVRVVRELEKQGFRFRSLSAVDHAVDHRVVSAEAVLFMGAIRHLRGGHPAKALDYLVAVLELNPKNKRARFLAETIQSAYIKALEAKTKQTRTWVLFNPTRLLRALDRTLGRVLFGWFGIVLLLLFVTAGAYAYATTQPPAWHVTLFDVILTIAISTAQFLAHEVGHGLACHHYGGEVTEIGLLWIYGLPGAYCDTSSSYLFTDRRHLVIVQMGGVYVSIIWAAVVFLLLGVLDPHVFFYQALLITAWWNVVLIMVNLVPFAKFDGYYAFCDWLGIPNLRDRSMNLLKARLSRRLLGIPSVEERLTPERARLFFWFAVASVVFTLWLYIGVIRLLAPFMETLRGLGFVLGVGALAYLLRATFVIPVWKLLKLLAKQRRHVFTIKRTIVLALLLACAIAPWTIETSVRVDGDFVVVPKQRASVRAQAAGTIDRVLVHEGETVRRGQPLAVLRNDEANLTTKTLAAQLDEVDSRLAQLRNGARREELDRASMRVAAANAASRRDTRRAAVANELASTGLGRGADALAASGSAGVTSSLASAASWQLAELRAGARTEDLDAAMAERAHLVAQVDHARAEIDLLTIRSPIDGVVVTKHLETRVTERLERGDLFTEVHDLSSFVAEIRVSSSEPLGELSIGDRVALESSGAPGTRVVCAVAFMRGPASRAKRSDDDGDDGGVVITTTPFTTAIGPTGIEGHARLYGKQRTLAYSMLYLPMQRALSVKLWSML